MLCPFKIVNDREFGAYPDGLGKDVLPTGRELCQQIPVLISVPVTVIWHSQIRAVTEDVS